MTDKPYPTTRRGILAGAAALAGLPILAASQEAHAAGTVPKASAKYQDHPSGPNMCGKCNYFLPGAPATGPGMCKLVAGPISPTGWCTLFAPKPH
jgi:hypothetical protein